MSAAWWSLALRLAAGVVAAALGATGDVHSQAVAYLRSAEAERPQVLNRKTLHAHLKEIDSL